VRGTLYRLAWFFYLALAVGGAVWIGLRTGDVPLALFVDPAGIWLDLALGAGTGLALVGLWEVARRRLSGAAQLEEHLAEILRGIAPGEVLALALLSGFTEELFFRGAVQGAWGIVPATLLFALLHTGPGAPFRLWSLFAAVAGLALGGLMLWRGNLLAPALAHFLVNAINLRRLVLHPATAPGPSGE
jgi:CAAX protease family protein